jgi:hypothetical protein
LGWRTIRRRGWPTTTESGLGANAEDLCAAWTLARASEEGVNPVLVAATLDNVRSGGASIQQIVRYETVTPLSARAFVS